MSSRQRVAIIGCGIFGALAALELAEAGFEVTVFERAAEILRGASLNNQNRLHLGFHYPRSPETRAQCVLGFNAFRERFAASIRDDFPNYYLIAASGSNQSPAEYLRCCDSLRDEFGVDYQTVPMDSLPVVVNDCLLAIRCSEVVYDSLLLAQIVRKDLAAKGITVRTGSEVESLRATARAGFELRLKGAPKPIQFDQVVNCSYADNNRLSRTLGLDVPERRYEYTAVLKLALDLPPIGITIMDGRFMTLLPFGHSSEFLLYHVDHTVIEAAEAAEMPASWRESAPFSALDATSFAQSYIADCSEFLPDLKKARLTGFLHGPRMVLKKRDHDDARPSAIETFNDLPGYYTVFSGKIDHCIWVAADLARLMRMSHG